MRLRELLTRAEQLNSVTPSNYEYILKLARPLGVGAIGDPFNQHLAFQDSFCRPLIART